MPNAVGALRRGFFFFGEEASLLLARVWAFRQRGLMGEVPWRHRLDASPKAFQPTLSDIFAAASTSVDRHRNSPSPKRMGTTQGQKQHSLGNS